MRAQFQNSNVKRSKSLHNDQQQEEEEENDAIKKEPISGTSASRSRFESVLLKGIERRLWLGLTSVSNRDFSKISIGSCAPFVFLINWTIQSGVSETFAFLKLRKVSCDTRHLLYGGQRVTPDASSYNIVTPVSLTLRTTGHQQYPMQHGTEVSNLEDAAGCSNDQTAQLQARIISGNAGRLLPPPSKPRLYDELVIIERAIKPFEELQLISKQLVFKRIKGAIGFTPNTLAIRSALINAKYFGISKICIKSDRQVFVKASNSKAFFG
ncbi:hypothetical protein F2Q69_00004613 [Brassica cretica]|uniref:Uncharacterized protein n=1 Tax=Brassica cretica TaxID=69181 RepID=A0A8S9P063_BRACR|nr:hypothetical protein F2Q69_00004613 [Brassica cretica]